MANSGKYKLQFINEGFRDILSSAGTQEVVQSVTDDIKSRCVSNYAAVSPDGVDAEAAFDSGIKQAKASKWTGRFVGFVSTNDPYAVAAETEDKIMTRAVT